MNILSAVKLAVAYLNLSQNLTSYFNEVSLLAQDEIYGEENILNITNLLAEQEKQEVETLLFALNNMQDTVSKNLQFIAKQQVTTINNMVSYSNIQEKLKQIISIEVNGKKVSYKLHDNYIVLNCSIKTSTIVTIEYSYFLPSLITLASKTPLAHFVPDKCLALGIAGEYCSIKGLFDDAKEYLENFQAELNKNKEKPTSFTMPARNWK